MCWKFYHSNAAAVKLTLTPITGTTFKEGFFLLYPKVWTENMRQVQWKALGRMCMGSVTKVYV